jgi:deferrochelatase/peroxidase EfeB
MPDLQTVAFHGPHQVGIATPQQEHLHFASFDVVSEDVSEVRDLMRAWSEAGARMSAGRPAGEENESSFLPPDDTGEAFGLSPARLTLTVGFGPTLFEKEGEDRFGGVMRGSGTARNRLGWRAAPTSWREGYGC